MRKQDDRAAALVYIMHLMTINFDKSGLKGEQVAVDPIGGQWLNIGHRKLNDY
jgi:hypothetical protein